MKRTYTIFLILLLMVSVLSAKAEEKNNKAAGNAKPKRLRYNKYEPTDAEIEWMINRLRQTDPKKAQKLVKLRAEDPEQFKTEFRNTMKAGLSGKLEVPRIPRKIDRKPKSLARQGVLLGEPMSQKDKEYLAWLKENYHQEAERLSELKKTNPKSYKKQFRQSLNKYGRIASASKKNPEFAEVLKKDLKLKEQCNELVEKIVATDEDKEKKELTKELETLAGRRFDLSMKKKQIKHQRLQDQLKKLQERIKQSKTELKKSKSTKFKNEQVKTTVKKMIFSKEISNKAD